MRTASICFSIFQLPKSRTNTTVSSWWEGFPSLGRTYKNYSGFKLVDSDNDGDKGDNRRWIRRPVTTQTIRTKKSVQISKLNHIGHDILDETLSPSTKVEKSKVGENQVQRIQYCEIPQKNFDNIDLACLVTVIVFDIETTGFSRENERIIEIALQDLRGGENSTFQTLVNPERYVPNSHVHGITTHMVDRPDVPRMIDLIPILLEYVKSRQTLGGKVIFVAHNARTFDVPFLNKEFSRCSFDIPSDWLFVDSLALARELMKSGGSTAPSKVSLQSLRELYRIPLDGSAHRAMSDVRVLSLVFQRITFDLKLPVSGLIERSRPFKDWDSKRTKKKKEPSI